MLGANDIQASKKAFYDAILGVGGLQTRVLS